MNNKEAIDVLYDSLGGRQDRFEEAFGLAIKALEKLTQYESTGLSPDVCKNYKLFEDELISKGITFKELLEYADKLYKEKQCNKCKWYANFEGVCCNGDSEYRADFRNGDDTCNKFEDAKSCEVSAKWIPVSEKLPSEKGWYQVFRNGHNHAEDGYFKGKSWSFGKEYGEVVAWQYLLEPYRNNI